jgi:hypothetical protein
MALSCAAPRAHAPRHASATARHLPACCTAQTECSVVARAVGRYASGAATRFRPGCLRSDRCCACGPLSCSDPARRGRLVRGRSPVVASRAHWPFERLCACAGRRFAVALVSRSRRGHGEVMLGRADAGRTEPLLPPKLACFRRAGAFAATRASHVCAARAWRR